MEEKQTDVRTSENGLQISCEIDDVLTYAAIHNGARIVRDICLKNTSGADLDQLAVEVSSENGLTEKLVFGIDKMKPEEERHFKKLDVMVNADYLASLTERVICQMTISIRAGNEQLLSKKVSVTVLAFDEWPGLQYTPELLTAFVMPNHYAVTSMLGLAANYLEKWTKDPSLAGYQHGGPNRVKHMAAAAYAAIQQKNIIYAEPPSSFEKIGQRIRLVDAVLDQHLGTCMDMTLFYVACLEAMGLNPVMIMMRGHIFAGVWLIDESFPEMIMEDPSQLEKRMSKGIHELIVVECTAMCAGKSRSFDEAVTLAEHNVANYKDFAFVIDVKRARSMGVRPLPMRVKTADGFEIRHEERNQKDITDKPSAVGETFDLPDSSGKGTATKQEQWERKLLDLSLRNMLINLRVTSAVVPLLSPDVSTLENALTEGEEFLVLPRPADLSVPDDGEIPVEALGEPGNLADFIALEGRHKRLHSFYTEKELNSSLTKMYRSAKTSMEENGAGTLYLALGLLRWFESRPDAVVRYAPVVLVPIDIVRKSASKGYAMRMRDEDAKINITLLEFLKQSFAIQIHGLNPPPTDEYGLDLPRIFAILRHEVMNLPMWDVVEAGFIGNFSFSQFVMWNDIHSRRDFLEKNKIVHSLISGAVEWDCTVPESVDTDTAYLPVTADASQLRAINMAAAGVSFVLHGPPGTGKSQTIAAMISNALAKGKTVLFVAEKMAALQVVQKRLEALGIQNFCLELYSNKATKKAVLDQLKRGLETAVCDFPTDYEKKIQDIQRMRMELDAYVKALHIKRPFGKSLRQLIDLYEMIPELGRDIRFDHTYAGTLTESDLENQMHSLERLVAAGKAIGHPCGHPLSVVHKTEYSQRMKFDLDTTMQAYRNVLEEFRSEAIPFAEQMELGTPVVETEWQNVCNCARSIIAAEEIPVFLINTDNVDREFEEPLAFLERQSAFSKKRETFHTWWSENFLRMDMSSFRLKYDEANKKLFGKKKALALLTSELQAYAFFSVETDRIPVYLTDVMFYQQELQELQNMEEALSYEWKALIKDYPDKDSLMAYKEYIRGQMQTLEKYSGQRRKLSGQGLLQACVQHAKNLLGSLTEVQLIEAQAQELLELEFEEGTEDWMESRLRLCSCILENASYIKDWIVYRQFADECRDRGLSPVCDAYEAGMSHDDVICVYLRSVYRAIILSVIEKEPVLNGFTGTGFNEKIAQFKKLDQEFLELTKDEMFYRLTHQLPVSGESVEISKELNLLRRAISSNGRGVAIRTLFEQIPHVLPRLCPCMLMSPISAAQYLKAENDLFDIVIFDEASQLPTCKAVGVLARGKNAVIAGDPNQMPPTSFFAGNKVDEENLDIEDLDSILDDCLALGMPQTYLHWHYRSRHESLIAFSNQEFYENAMLTFPSVNDRERRVSLVKTEGFFERGKGRVNRGEARAIVADIRRRYQDPERTGQSVGVVTFNISQQILIEDLLQEEYQRDAEFDKWANTGEEPVFVKNLENVQGDERDVILFSIAFGPDADGRMSLNFGPLNKDGGYKRLNVAVSRARSEMMVFTIMTAEMINLRRTKSRGVESLKNFLEFAGKGRLQGEYAETTVSKDQGIMEHICQHITDAGYQYQKAVGHSRFKVDIAVINPYKEEEYLLGILLDGESYRQSANTKDREVAQISVLKSLGWRLHRVWTMDWWDNREKELLKLTTILSERKEEARRQCQGEPVEEVSEERAYEEEDWKKAEKASAAVEPDIVNEYALAEVKEAGETVITEPEELKEYETAIVAVGERLISEPGEAARRAAGKVAAGSGFPPDDRYMEQEEPEYRIEEYVSADVEITDLSAADYVKKENLPVISRRLQQIIDTEAPVTYDRLMKKTLRSFHIARSSAQTLEATDRALKKTSSRVNKQSGVKFYWRKDQDPELYRVYRKDADSGEKRSADEICQQELKNAVYCTLREKGALGREELVRETVRTMGYARSGAALAAAVERGLKYGRKTGEIVQDEKRRFTVGGRLVRE